MRMEELEELQQELVLHFDEIAIESRAKLEEVEEPVDPVEVTKEEGFWYHEG